MSQVYDLLNALEERLGAANSAVVLAATKAFLHLTLSLPATHQQVMCVLAGLGLPLTLLFVVFARHLCAWINVSRRHGGMMRVVRCVWIACWLTFVAVRLAAGGKRLD